MRIETPGYPISKGKYKVEQHIRSLGVPYTIIAPVFLFENILAPFLLQGLKKGNFAIGLPPNRKLKGIALADVASCDTLVLERRDEFLGKRINIASDELSGTEYARAISDASGKKIDYHQNPLEQVRKLSEDFARMEEWFDRVGYSADIEALRRDYPEVEWTRFGQWVRAQDWSVLRA
jgi:uncharacterized protein YbjT (DUF2867 family)